ncbi:MAG TPA: dihydrofolate reductase family protein [Pseudonocardiaceae bacterium]|nr:dihydrofolate reductase family protein [Pseudonocardiaceae bacterium]
MATVVTNASMSVDGYIADPSDGCDDLFGWYDNGEVELPSPSGTMTFHLSDASAGYLRGISGELGTLVVGRRLFDITNGWDGRHPFDVPVFVVTHSVPTDWPHIGSAPFTFVTDGVVSAVEQAKKAAGDRTVAVAAGKIASQALDAGLVDEVVVDLVPVVLGAGVPYFASLATKPVKLDNPTILAGDRVLHLRYPVLR